MQILGPLGLYFDAVVVFFTNSSLLFRFAVAILCAVVRPTLHYLPILYVNTKDDDRLYPGK